MTERSECLAHQVLRYLFVASGRMRISKLEEVSIDVEFSDMLSEALEPPCHCDPNQEQKLKEEECLGCWAASNRYRLPQHLNFDHTCALR